MGKKIGYARVSTTGQELAGQIERLQAYGCDKIFTEKQSGAKSDREQLAAALDYMREGEGDTLVVTKLDRLARSVLDLHKIAQRLQSKAADLIVMDQAIDTTTPAGRFMFTMLGAVAEFERDIIHERSAEGRARAKAAGKHMGRPAQDPKKIKQAVKLFNDRESNGLTVADIVKMTGIPRASIYAEVKKLQS